MKKTLEPTRPCGDNSGVYWMSIDERNRLNPTKRNQSYGEEDLGLLQPARASKKTRSYPHKTSIVFFGSGPVAAASLASLANNFDVEAVITKQAPAHHHGSAPVAELAEELGLKLHFANTRAQLDILMSSHNLTARLGVIVDYGVIVSDKVIDAFSLGILNSHFSLLPQWRGADPITFTVLSGQSESGVSLMLIVEALDEGDLISQDTLPITADITTPILTDQLVSLSNHMLARDIPRYISGELRPYPQPNIPATYSRKLTKADGIIDYKHKPASQLEREVRAYIQWPNSRLQIAGKDATVTQAHTANYLDATGKDKPFITSDGLLGLPTAKGVLTIDRLKPAGKREMSAKEFLAGYGRLL